MVAALLLTPEAEAAVRQGHVTWYYRNGPENSDGNDLTAASGVSATAMGALGMRMLSAHWRRLAGSNRIAAAFMATV